MRSLLSPKTGGDEVEGAGWSEELRGIEIRKRRRCLVSLEFVVVRRGRGLRKVEEEGNEGW